MSIILYYYYSVKLLRWTGHQINSYLLTETVYCIVFPNLMRISEKNKITIL